MPTTCQFQFSRTTPIYYSGEQINGYIALNTTKQLAIEGIQIALVGTEHVEWLERCREALLVHNDSTEKDNKVLYSDMQERLYESYTLMKRTSLQAGELCVKNFCFDLPCDAPASCDMKYGQRVYNVRLTLQCRTVSDKIFKARLTVKNRKDLSTATELSEPHTLAVTNASATGAHALLRFTLSTGTGYVPGQNIAYTLCGQHTFAACNKLYVYLCQHTTFSVTTPQAKRKEHLKVLNTDIQKISSSYVMVGGQLSIPLAAHICLEGNAKNLIHIGYHIEAMLVYKKRILQKLIIPIVIGTVPPKSVQDGNMKRCAEDLEQYYCYDNLGTDEFICDTKTENSLVEIDMLCYLPEFTSVMLLNSLSPRSEKQNCALGSCTADICKQFQQQIIVE
uniref:Arrestin domain-containing protein 5 n=1 Tax=Zeugodacus cucurbitae TaxID=28588 RepID=A0A0A1WGX8_ZEUCU